MKYSHRKLFVGLILLQSSIVLLGLKQDGLLPPGFRQQCEEARRGISKKRPGSRANIQMLDDFVQGSLNYRFGEIQTMQIDLEFFEVAIWTYFSPHFGVDEGDMQHLRWQDNEATLNDLHFRFSITEVKACYQLESKIFRMFPMGWEGSVAAGMDTPSPSAKTAEVGKFICGHRQLKKLHCATWT